MIVRLCFLLRNTHWATLKQYNSLKQTHSGIQIPECLFYLWINILRTHLFKGEGLYFDIEKIVDTNTQR